MAEGYNFGSAIVTENIEGKIVDMKNRLKDKKFH